MLQPFLLFSPPNLKWPLFIFLVSTVTQGLLVNHSSLSPNSFSFFWREIVTQEGLEGEGLARLN